MKNILVILLVVVLGFLAYTALLPYSKPCTVTFKHNQTEVNFSTTKETNAPSDQR
ncbi:hypothetical protein [Clostridium sp.]|uniref:hypothetical protein n=1 Tax=Clostridium sp. TaxID=1506 RepID=UPI00283E0E7E|nr:hypothetical protein [Clostridium sp.]MDR3594154.1 hypothetical protein [Clostridium sp.]